MSTFVSVGNAKQPFDRLLEVVCKISHRLPQPVIVQNGHTLCEYQNCNTVGFLDMREFESHMQSADLLILHAGAGSVMHAIRSGKVPVVMPRRAQFNEHVDDHQVEFAMELAKLQKILMVDDDRDLLEAVKKAQVMANVPKSGTDSVPEMVSLIDQVLLSYSRYFSTK